MLPFMYNYINRLILDDNYGSEKPYTSQADY